MHPRRVASPLVLICSASAALAALVLAPGADGAHILAPAAAAKKARKAKRAAPQEAPPADPRKAEEAAERAEERTAPARFEWVARTPEQEMSARADAKRDEAMAKLQKLMPTIPEGPQKAELIFRLSEMYWAKSKFKHLQAMQVWDQQLEQWHDGGAKGAQPKLEEVAQFDEANLFKRQALDLYEQILAKYPDYNRKDEVLYNLGASLYESGKKQEGVKHYWDLIKQYPESDYVADAWLELGEHFFNSNKLSNAVKAYTKAAESKKPRIYSFAVYKLAWCDYNLGDYENALKKFREVVSYAKRQSKGGEFAKKDRIQLTEEALNDMVRAYSHLDAVEDAFEYYLSEVGEDEAYGYLSRLGKLYHKEGKYAVEVRLYKELNDRYPYHPQAPANQTAIMNAYAAADKKDAVRAEVRRLVDLYSPNGTWARRNAGNQKVLDQAFEVVEEQLAGLVTEQHRAAQETKLSEIYLLARDIYKEYLDKFPDTKNAYDFRFFFAEILYELKQFEDAAPQYDAVVESDPKGKFARHAAYAAVLTWEKVAAGVKETVGKKIQEGKLGKSKGELKQLEKLQKLEKGGTYAPTELTSAEQRLADACDRFVRVAPDDDEVVKVKFKSARLYYIHNQFEEAAVRFGEIIDKWPKDSLARVSAESIVESFNVREDWSALNQWARKFRDNKLLMADRSFAQKIHEFVEGATFNEIHFVFEPKKTPAEVGDHYAEFAREFPKSKYAMVGLYNAMVNYDRANLLEKSLATARTILDEYRGFTISEADYEKSRREGSALPKPEDIREKTLFLAGSFHERLAEFETAADLYEQYAREFKQGPRRADALFNAGLFREGLGQHDAAIANFESYIQDYPKKDDVPQIAWRIGLILEKKGDMAAVARHFGGYGKYARGQPARKLCADHKVVAALEKEGRAKEREVAAGYKAILADYAKLSAADKATDCALLAAAAGAFNAIEADFNSYLAIPLTGVSEKQMAKNLIAKLEQVESLQKRYTNVLALGQGDYGIAALYRIGYIFQHLAQEMFNTPCPSRLTEDQCMIYQAALQEKAFPLEEKAIEAFDKAMAKAYELGLYNEWLAKAQDAMRTYEPGRFPEIHEYDLIASEAAFEVPALVELSR